MPNFFIKVSKDSSNNNNDKITLNKQYEAIKEFIGTLTIQCGLKYPNKKSIISDLQKYSYIKLVLPINKSFSVKGQDWHSQELYYNNVLIAKNEASQSTQLYQDTLTEHLNNQQNTHQSAAINHSRVLQPTNVNTPKSSAFTSTLDKKRKTNEKNSHESEEKNQRTSPTVSITSNDSSDPHVTNTLAKDIQNLQIFSSTKTFTDSVCPIAFFSCLNIFKTDKDKQNWKTKNGFPSFEELNSPNAAFTLR